MLNHGFDPRVPPGITIYRPPLVGNRLNQPPRTAPLDSHDTFLPISADQYHHYPLQRDTGLPLATGAPTSPPPVGNNHHRPLFSTVPFGAYGTALPPKDPYRDKHNIDSGKRQTSGLNPKYGFEYRAPYVDGWEPQDDDVLSVQSIGRRKTAGSRYILAGERERQFSGRDQGRGSHPSVDTPLRNRYQQRPLGSPPRPPRHPYATTWQDDEYSSDSEEELRPQLRRKEFTGKSDGDAFIEWLDKVERNFNYKKYGDPKQVMIIESCLTGFALTWWNSVQQARRTAGYRPISEWWKMRRELKERFIPMNYGEVAFGKLQSLKMGLSSLDDYTDQYYLLEACARLHETEQQRVIRYKSGLTKKLQEATTLQPVFCLVEIVQLAKQANELHAQYRSPVTTPAATAPRTFVLVEEMEKEEEEVKEGFVLVARKGCVGLPTACSSCLPVYLYLRFANVDFDLRFNLVHPDSAERNMSSSSLLQGERQGDNASRSSSSSSSSSGSGSSSSDSDSDNSGHRRLHNHQSLKCTKLSFTLEAKRSAKWDDEVDQLQFSYNGKVLEIPEEVAEISINVIPVTEQDDKVHNYQIPSNDCFAHLEVQFRFFGISTDVEGVLGQTYRPDFKNPAKPGVAMPVVGGDDKYRTTSLISSDCASCKFSPAGAAEKENLLVMDYGTLDCSHGINNGNGIVCRK
ncbi:hypothetical protein GIB67_025075 [Kingdonia uniflora]|uniref:Retrotransposon gag domain-containing protein n=1 Tax=Kingdonia uniflora TaxID=39325 RepID=A0A7J7N7K2_9MAGN|nr:hypothetical protein GIB67_025075 [Kingdonia uniflora]